MFGQSIYISPEEELVVVKLSSWPEFLSIAQRMDVIAAIRANWRGTPLHFGNRRHRFVMRGELRLA